MGNAFKQENLCRQKQGLISSEAAPIEQKPSPNMHVQPGCTSSINTSRAAYNYMFPFFLLLTVIEKMRVNKLVFCGLACQHWLGQRLGTKSAGLYRQGKQEVNGLLKVLLMVLIDGFHCKVGFESYVQSYKPLRYQRRSYISG